MSFQFTRCPKESNTNRQKENPEMSATQFKKIAPDLFNEIYDLGIKAERRRRYEAKRNAEIKERVRIAPYGRTEWPL
jgi:hypothetical protein